MTEEKEESLAENLENEKEGEDSPHHAPGTAVLAIIFLLSFAVYYFANWKALADLWELR